MLILVAIATKFEIKRNSFAKLEVENLQNGDFHLAEIPDFGMRNLENHLVH